jgi:hypothetical protein
MKRDASRARAAAVLLAFAAALLLGVVLVVAFDPDVQTIGPAELVARSDDARRFLIGDYFFVAVYAVASPIAQWRFGAVLGEDRPRWMRYAPLLLVAAGIVDATENALLLSATDAEAEGTVDTAHALAAPKVILFVAAALLAIGVAGRAVRVLAR